MDVGMLEIRKRKKKAERLNGHGLSTHYSEMEVGMKEKNEKLIVRFHRLICLQAITKLVLFNYNSYLTWKSHQNKQVWIKIVGFESDFDPKGASKKVLHLNMTNSGKLLNNFLIADSR